MSETPTPRPIRFRVWDATDRVMRSDLFYQLGRADPGRHTLSQYTGLDTDDGTPIYEGDIVDGHSQGGFEEMPESSRVIARWCSDYGKWVGHDPFNGEDFDLYDYSLLHSVVGNTWEHPGLVRDEDELENSKLVQG